MGLFRRDLLTLPMISAFLPRAFGQAIGVPPDGVDRNGQPEPLPKIQPIRRDLKGDRERNVKELAQLEVVVRDLRELVDKTDPSVVSAPLLKKADEMRALSQKIYGRLRFDYK